VLDEGVVGDTGWEEGVEVERVDGLRGFSYLRKRGVSEREAVGREGMTYLRADHVLYRRFSRYRSLRRPARRRPLLRC
jgi:hypothetical protein